MKLNIDGVVVFGSDTLTVTIPDGWVLVPVKDLLTIEHRLLNAERVFKRDLVNHKFMGFHLISSSIDMVSAMLPAVKEKDNEQ